MGFYPGDPNDWSKEDDDHLHNFDPKDRKVSFSFFPRGITSPGPKENSLVSPLFRSADHSLDKNREQG